jgi:hypothetical protein
MTWFCLSCDPPGRFSGEAFSFWEWWSLRPDPLNGPNPWVATGHRNGRLNWQLNYYGQDSHGWSYLTYNEKHRRLVSNCQCFCYTRVRVSSYEGVVIGGRAEHFGVAAAGNTAPKHVNEGTPPQGFGIPTGSRHDWGYDVVCALGFCRVVHQFGIS